MRSCCLTISTAHSRTRGRKQDLTVTLTVGAEELSLLIAAFTVHSVAPVADGLYIVKLNAATKGELEGLNSVKQQDLDLISSFSSGRSNVAIAAAITATARIHMMKYKLDPSCVYSDTDSIFTKDILNLVKTGDGLGEFKDELQGKTISLAQGYISRN